MTKPSRTIAVVGTGIMGAGIATNFLKNGYKVYVWNRSKDKLEPLVKLGATEVKTPKEAAEKSDILFEVTASDKSSKSVWLGKNGIIKGADRNKVLIVCGTLSVKWVEKLASICVKNNLTFLDMPMTGSRKGAESGELVFLVGGDKKVLDNLRKDLKAISETVYYFGKVGNGMRFKLILNMLQAIHMIGLGETLVLAKNIGLNLDDVGNTLIDRPGGAPTNSGWRGYQKQPDQVNFAVKWITKDLKYAKKLAKGLQTPLLDKALAKYNKAIQANLGEKDWTIVNKFKV